MVAGVNADQCGRGVTSECLLQGRAEDCGDGRRSPWATSTSTFAGGLRVGRIGHASSRPRCASRARCTRSRRRGGQRCDPWLRERGARGRPVASRRRWVGGRVGSRGMAAWGLVGGWPRAPARPGAPASTGGSLRGSSEAGVEAEGVGVGGWVAAGLGDAGAWGSAGGPGGAPARPGGQGPGGGYLQRQGGVGVSRSFFAFLVAGPNSRGSAGRAVRCFRPGRGHEAKGGARQRAVRLFRRNRLGQRRRWAGLMRSSAVAGFGRVPVAVTRGWLQQEAPMSSLWAGDGGFRRGGAWGLGRGAWGVARAWRRGRGLCGC